MKNENLIQFTIVITGNMKHIFQFKEFNLKLDPIKKISI